MPPCHASDGALAIHSTLTMAVACSPMADMSSTSKCPIFPYAQLVRHQLKRVEISTFRSCSTSETLMTLVLKP